MASQAKNAVAHLNSEAERLDVPVKYFAGRHAFIVYPAGDGWALKGIVNGTLITLQPRLTASAVYDKFTSLVETAE